MDWQLNNDMPIYTQLVHQIRFGIVSGHFAPGGRLAAVRDMAAEAGVNPNTMQRALQELEREGLVYTQRSSGRFVTEDRARIEDARRELAEQHIHRFLDAMRGLGYGNQAILTLLCAEEEKNGNNI